MSGPALTNFIGNADGDHCRQRAGRKRLIAERLAAALAGYANALARRGYRSVTNTARPVSEKIAEILEKAS